MTKDQLITWMASRKQKKLLQSADWGDLITAIGDLSAEEKDEIAKQVATGQSVAAVQNLSRIMQTNAMQTAKTEATTALADDNLTLAEMQSLL